MKQVGWHIGISRTLLIRREGRIEANIETAQRLLAMGLPTEQVAKATQLPLDLVQNLSN